MTRRLIEDDFTAVEATIGEKVVWVVPFKDIYEAPTVDAEPIRYGEWIECEGRNNEYYCSKCYDIWKSDRIKDMKRCPSCGAKMEAEEQSTSENSEELIRVQAILEHFGEEVEKIAEELGKTLSAIAERFSDVCNEYLKSEDDNDRKTD